MSRSSSSRIDSGVVTSSSLGGEGVSSTVWEPSCRRKLSAALLLALLTLTIACGSKRPVTRTIPPPPVQPKPQEQPATTATKPPEKTFPTAKVPAPEENPDDEFAEYKDAKPIWSETGYASWYGPPYHNRRGANGEIYNENAMTAAHRELPMGSVVRVTNLKTGSQAMLRITDRGPFIGDRIIDLSLAAAKKLDVWRPGTAKVRVDVLYAPSDIESGGRWCVQVGAFTEEDAAIRLKASLQKRYHTAKVLEFAGPTGFWVRVRVKDDDKSRAEEVANVIGVD
ncbi:MAG TPA: septal ring lytic transglycosylase RlpA family protein, partial [Terriglobales bacterium]|nr:septal ring lytic transglycosylase RlpA family protein [Terriglobales bacterium]